MKLKNIITSIFCVGFYIILAQTSSTLLYKVTKNDLKNPSYIWGTYHLLSKKFIDEEKPKVNTALKKCEGIIVEVEINEHENLKLLPYLVAPKDSTIPIILTENEYELVSRILKKETGLNLSSFNKLKPFNITAALIKQSNIKSINDSKKYGNSAMDLDFIEYANTNNLSITALETVDEQANLLFKSSIASQKKALLTTINEINKVKYLQDSLYFAYKNEDVKLLENLLNNYEYEANEMDMEALLKNRNLNWVNKLPNLFKEKSQFVAVGAGHLLGEFGILNLLKKLGYQIEPITQ
ncbi:MAG: TraB/GumN family protein [Bacteroidetes bacterium]|nr:TraB/GumN family protein [Bacteroidota bacterium]